MNTNLMRNWWLLVLRGVFGIAFGVVALIWPRITLEILVYLFGFYVLFDGLFAILTALTEHPEMRQWWALVLEGLVGMSVGLATFVWPGVTTVVLLYLIAFWAISTGILEVLAALHLRKHLEGEWTLWLFGVLSILLGLILVAFPDAGALAVVWLIAANAIGFGLMMVDLGLRLRRHQHAAAGGYHPFAR